MRRNVTGARKLVRSYRTLQVFRPGQRQTPVPKVLPTFDPISFLPDFTQNPSLRVTLDSETLRQLPKIPTPAPVFVSSVDNAESILRSKFSTAKLIGFDCEWKPQWEKGGSARPIALLQISSHTDVALLYVLKWKRLPPSLVRLFQDPQVVKFCHDPWDEMTRLKSQFGLKFSSVVDTLHLARLFQCKPASLNCALAAFSSYTYVKNKKVQMSNWEQIPYSPKQIEYASADAHASLLVGVSLMRRIKEIRKSECSDLRRFALENGLFMGIPNQDFEQKTPDLSSVLLDDASNTPLDWGAPQGFDNPTVFTSTFRWKPTEFLFFSVISHTISSNPRKDDESLPDYISRINTVIHHAVPRFFKAERSEGHCSRCYLPLLDRFVENFSPQSDAHTAREFSSLKAIQALRIEKPDEFGKMLESRWQKMDIDPSEYSSEPFSGNDETFEVHVLQKKISEEEFVQFKLAAVTRNYYCEPPLNRELIKKSLCLMSGLLLSSIRN
jgi:hypothetical protein